ncbi:MAG: hypothetical protein K0Q74_372 [Gammaproteobacteria bacterium]|jgi:osmotically inducible lipoprotein OsmB|nr:hypothetical protein [Gammaproteobacteria bacterium]
MKKFIMTLLIVVSGSLALAGCQTSSGRETVGTIGGGVAGGYVGSALTGGNTLGTIGGTLGGAYVGREVAKNVR